MTNQPQFMSVTVRPGVSSQSGGASSSVTIPYRANLLGNIEQALKGLQGYGIMALELIQNADDAGATSLVFDVRDDGLVVGNDAGFSSCGLQDAECPWIRSGDPSGLKRPCNFHAIAEMGSRSKVHAAEQIGRFGIGFVSVYQITDTPIVRSAGVELRLNPQTQEVLKSAIEAVPGTEFVLPWASEQSGVRDGLNASPTPSDVANKVVAEVELVLQGSLLFLRHVRRVELRRKGGMVVAVEIERVAEGVTLRFEPANVSQRWLVLSRDATDVIAAAELPTRFEALSRLDRSTAVSVAIPLNLEEVKGLLYAYLPTRQSMRMPFHLKCRLLSPRQPTGDRSRGRAARPLLERGVDRDGRRCPRRQLRPHPRPAGADPAVGSRGCGLPPESGTGVPAVLGSAWGHRQGRSIYLDDPGRVAGAS